MKIQLLKLRTFLMLMLLYLPVIVSAHEMGTLSGMVRDSIQGFPLAGANISLGKTMLGTTSNFKGEFEFRNIHAGKYTVIISYLGYAEKVVAVEVHANETTTLDIMLSPSNIGLEGVSVVAERPYSAASLMYIRNTDLALRINKSSQDLLKLVPGLITAQHAGGGKAEQIFLRGFDADHGTDINISVDGVPVNMVSHGHGQGYADLHFVIPELVNELEVFKGPYFAHIGNLGTAGAVSFKTPDILPGSLVKMEAGQFNTLKTTLLIQPDKGSAEQNGYFAAQYYTSDGPFESPQNLQRMNLFGKYFVTLGHSSKLTLSAGSFASSWDASGQIPQRAVDRGTITRFGAIDDLEGGTTSRTDLNLSFELKNNIDRHFVAQVYLVDYSFRLYSNFSFFLDDTVAGDMIEQLDNRTLFGSSFQYDISQNLGEKLFKSSIGGGFRADNVSVGLNHSPNRVRQSIRSNADVWERNLYLWYTGEWIFSSKFRIQIGLRGDYFTFNVSDYAGTALEADSSGIPHASGYAQQGIVNPKVSMVYSPMRNLDVFLNAGSGFHSNDARDVVIGEKIKELEKVWTGAGYSQDQINETLISLNFDPDQKNTTTLPRALGAEAGFRTRLVSKLDLAVAAWYMHMEKEYVYVGDGGYTELSDPTQRIGIDLELRYRLQNWLWLDVDLCVSEGKIIGLPEQENSIPLAPQVTSTGGLTMKDLYGFDASLRYTYVGDRPANEINSVIAEGFFTLNMGVAYYWKDFCFSFTMENITNIDWKEAQFDTESRLKGEPTPVSENHFTPGNPRNVQAGISYRF